MTDDLHTYARQVWFECRRRPDFGRCCSHAGPCVSLGTAIDCGAAPAVRLDAGRSQDPHLSAKEATSGARRAERCDDNSRDSERRRELGYILCCRHTAEPERRSLAPPCPDREIRSAVSDAVAVSSNSGRRGADSAYGRPSSTRPAVGWLVGWTACSSSAGRLITSRSGHCCATPAAARQRHHRPGCRLPCCWPPFSVLPRWCPLAVQCRTLGSPDLGGAGRPDPSGWIIGRHPAGLSELAGDRSSSAGTCIGRSWAFEAAPVGDSDTAATRSARTVCSCIPAARQHDFLVRPQLYGFCSVARCSAARRSAGVRLDLF
jgi:hypothetical protein